MSVGILGGWSGLGGTTQMAKDFPHHVPLETAHDFGLALALSHVAPDVVQ
jgi:hypothetical protein